MEPTVMWLLVDETGMGALEDFTLRVDDEGGGLRHLGRPALSAEDALNRSLAERPDVVLLDPGLPLRSREVQRLTDREHGAWCAVEIRRQRPATQVLLFSNDIPRATLPGERERVQRMDAAGVIGYVTKDATYEEIAQAILAAARGEPTFKPGAAHQAWRACLAPIPHPCFEGPAALTQREHAAMVLLAQTGWGDQEIGANLRPPIGPAWASQLIRAACDKLGLSGASRGELIVWARENCPALRSPE